MKKRSMGPKGDGRQRAKNHKKNYLHGNYIYVTDHAITRYRQRIKKINHENAKYSIIENVKRSRLIALTKYGGREIRENRGVLYVCELQGNCLYVITILIGDVDLRFVV
ncbi:MAG TPA: hypothetical protein VFD89_02900 [Clostridia bacterium]|nr:hypothetical protein [Clostridia bacterium]